MTEHLPFPEGFVWGASTAAYQIEGAVNEGGRGQSIWDAFSHIPGKTHNGDTGDVAIDHYHRYKEDVQLMKQLGLKSYRLSISWPRIIPAGIGEVNEEGVAFYNDLINELLANGIEPMVTLYHWDLPLRLQLEFDGWLGGQKIQDAYLAYARVCFERFGDRIKTWLTLNEPWVFSFLGYGIGLLAPGRSHNRETEPYLVGHRLMVTHAHAVDMYRREFKPTQGGRIGIALSCDWREPVASADPVVHKQNQDAAERALVFHLGWFADPIYFGDYPQLMKDRVGDRLPTFTDEEKALLKGSVDFFALNSYTCELAEASEHFLEGTRHPMGGWIADEGVKTSADPSWKKTGTGWNVVPWGFKKLLVWIQKRYSPEGGIYITENGCAWQGKTKEESINDDFRVDFYKGYVGAMREAIAEGADVRGYFMWSFIDNFRWASGYSQPLGITFVDMETMERTPKKSSHWYSSVIRKNGLVEAEASP